MRGPLDPELVGGRDIFMLVCMKESCP